MTIDNKYNNMNSEPKLLKKTTYSLTIHID